MEFQPPKIKPQLQQIARAVIHTGVICMNHQILAEQPSNRQVELLQTEVARLNHKCERQAAEMLSMQAEIDLLKSARETERAIEEEIYSTVCLRDEVRL